MGKTKKEVKRNRPARKCSMNKCLAQIAAIPRFRWLHEHLHVYHLNS